MNNPQSLDHRDATARVTMEDVAKRAGVSRALVSKAFRDIGVSPQSRKAIFTAAKELGYRHNQIAANLASHRTNTIGLFILDLYNEVFADIYTGLRAITDVSAKKVILAIGDPYREAEASDVDGLLSMRVESAVLAGSLLPDDLILRINQRTPIVMATRLVAGVDSVAIDDRRGGRIATEHLLALGHRHIVFLASPTDILYASREGGYRDAVEDAGHTPHVVVGGFMQDSAADAARNLLSGRNRPTAIFANNDLLALGVLQAAAELDLAVPDDVSVIGFDDTRLSALPGINLTTVTQHARRLGELAAELAITDSADPHQDARHVLLDPSLVIRRSTAAAASA